MAIINRISQAVFTLFELVISSIYIHSLLGILRTKLDIRTRRVMRDLVCDNITVITMDLLVIVLIYLNKVNLAYPVQDFTYAFKFKIEFAVLNQLMAVATQGSRNIRRRGANFEHPRYRRPGTTLMLKGYSDDDISGVPLPFVSCAHEGIPQKTLSSRRNKQQPQRSTHSNTAKTVGVSKPSSILIRSQNDTNENATAAHLTEKPKEIYDMDFAFSSGPSLELSASNPPSRDGRPNLTSILYDQPSDDTLLAPVADDHDDETLAETLPTHPPRQQHPRRQRNSLRHILFGWRKPPPHRDNGDHSPIATLNPGPLPGYSHPESIGHLAGSNAQTPPPRAPSVKDRRMEGEESESDDEGFHTWERRGRIAQELPWFRELGRPSIHRAKTT